MNRFQATLLAVWREVSRHLEIHESVDNLSKLLAQHLPLGQVVVRLWEASHGDMVTVAAEPLVAGMSTPADRREFTSSEVARLRRWCQRGNVLHGSRTTRELLSLIAPANLPGDLLAAPLCCDRETIGVLLVAGHESQRFGSRHEEWADKLREPFTVALQNDRRIHEMARLREAAEADRGALLRRLGRTDLTETIVGEETGLRHVIERVELVSNSDVPVLVLGETGTGKEVVARAIHTRSHRHAGPFIRVNCGAIPAELIDSQLFGHERGSFTGADQTRQGWFERADGGTLFLDEIGELPLPAQVRLLRVLQDGFVERVGGTHPIHVDVRIVAATHRDLAQMVRVAQFREDLWYRLAVFPMLLPPLRERRDDIPALAHHFAARAALRFGLPVCSPATDDVLLLQSYDWPGNIRELGAVIDRAAILGNGDRLEVSTALGWPQVANKELQSHTHGSRATAASQPAAEIPTLDQAARQHIEHVLQVTHGRIEGKQGAARILGINPHTLRARMRKLGVDWSAFRTA